MSEPQPLMAGKRGLVMGVANDRSIAWGIATATHAQGAELAFTYQGEGVRDRVADLAREFGTDLVLPCDVTNDAEIEAVFSSLAGRWDGLDGLVHAIAFAPLPTVSQLLLASGSALLKFLKWTRRRPPVF